jgi:hypothetical protein
MKSSTNRCSGGNILTRYTAEIDEPFIVFLIGMRVNRIFAVRKWVRTARAMNEMLQRPGRTFDMLPSSLLPTADVHGTSRRARAPLWRVLSPSRPTKVAQCQACAF